MSHLFEEEKKSIIDLIVLHIEKKLSKKHAALCSEFVRQYFMTMSIEDLKESSIDDLYGLAVNFWSLIRTRQPNETKIKIYNPNIEEHGWKNTHTVVELICDDMPFIVDSLRIVLKRMDIGLFLTVHMGGIRLIRDKEHQISAILPRFEEAVPRMLIEAPILMKIDRQNDPTVLKELESQFHRVLIENRAVVDDWDLMRKKVWAIAEELQHAPVSIDQDEIQETQAFLRWLAD
ncbi:MAG TPA: NAD-glutamate dehydrogenase, partial [Legionellaceae bacterium]|nr:NAD-glutamate dehydrogenase [Legionellaceae bacterium]